MLYSRSIVVVRIKLHRLVFSIFFGFPDCIEVAGNMNLSVKFCKLAPNNFGSLLRKVFRVTMNFEWALDFWQNYAPPLEI